MNPKLESVLRKATNLNPELTPDEIAFFAESYVSLAMRIEEIKNQLKGIDIDELTRAEKNILRIVTF